MSDAIVRENSLQVNGLNYFRVGSQFVVLGAVGPKRSPIGKGNYLEVEDRIKGAKLKIREIGPIKIDSQRTNKRDFLANINLAKVFKLGSVDTAYQAVLDSKLDLFLVSVDPMDMVRAINDSPAIRESLKQWGDAARVVTAAFTIVDAKTSKTFSSSTDVEANLTVQGVTINPKVGVSQGGSTAVEWGPGQSIAYDISKVEWDDPNEKKATKVRGLRRDDHGL